MKVYHRGKAIEAYKGARVMEEMGLIYPSYILLKESLRATLAYIGEDFYGMNYSEKTKLKTLLSNTPLNNIDGFDISVFNILLDLEGKGLKSMMSTEVEVLKPARKALKILISMYLGERL